ncbi:hypothetical protein F3Y22_tig00110678pilonHSYRG00484 [Hibiscus syriacus]|uniref:PRA1 family protein n=1 Tax=Hibiscus syriacus TaxID=106335 RepID=A0A6A2ZVS8_HIBSY|nr:hypothetical protein F3Y22_tig00110678pilonHSYRG00484 [Hibiscus syriacus]
MWSKTGCYPSFELWLRDSDYLDVIDNIQTAVSIAASTSTPKISDSTITIPITTNNFSGETPSWTEVFFADFGSYSFPASISQARLRVQENVKRYAQNYALFFYSLLRLFCVSTATCTVRLISSLVLWDSFRCNGEGKTVVLRVFFENGSQELNDQRQVAWRSNSLDGDVYIRLEMYIPITCLLPITSSANMVQGRSSEW